jgi:hypothetical protein
MMDFAVFPYPGPIRDQRMRMDLRTAANLNITFNNSKRPDRHIPIDPGLLVYKSRRVYICQYASLFVRSESLISYPQLVSFLLSAVNLLSLIRF